jgi:hypothetical protein
MFSSLSSVGWLYQGSLYRRNTCLSVGSQMMRILLQLEYFIGIGRVGDQDVYGATFWISEKRVLL